MRNAFCAEPDVPHRLSRMLVICLFVLLAPMAASAAPKLAILGEADARRYAEIFDLQDAGDFRAADRLIAKLKNTLLLGHVRFQRYMHPTAYKSEFAELKAWLDRYSDHPEAYRVFSLAMKRKPKAAREPKRPVHGEEHILKLVGEPPVRPAPFVGPAERRARDIRAHVGKGRNAAAERLLASRDTRKVLQPLQRDVLAAKVAMGYFVDGDDKSAYRLASPAAKRSGDRVAQAHWVAALSAYRRGWIETAVRHFEAHAQAERDSTWDAAAGAFWAGRIHLALRDIPKARYWLGQAARRPRTFYGQLALHGLGAESPFDWYSEEATAADIARLSSRTAGKRALALFQAGERWRADQELQPLVEDAEPADLSAILAVALAYDAPRVAVQAAFHLRKAGGAFQPAGYYPSPPWTPAGEYGLDRALLFAFMRQESQFNPRATSFAGARGLMQLMPTTANYVVGEQRFVKARRDGLYDPEANVEIGARYLAYLMDKEAVDGDLFRLAIAYNGGIGNLARWLKEVRHNDDPLLFIEAIPSRETRKFVERVMSNIWMYRDRFGQPATSREDVAMGRWPRYLKQDD